MDFFFKKKAFILYTLQNMNANQRFCFEGKDDIEITDNNKIYGIAIAPNNYIQVKSGTVDITCLSKVICNWLLLNNPAEDIYTLFIENSFNFELSDDDIVEQIISYVYNGEKKKKTAIAKKVHMLYCDDIKNNNSQKLRGEINKILRKTQLEQYSIEDLDLKLKSIFFNNHCQDIIEYKMAKERRLEKFIDYINRQIDESIKKKKTYSLIFSELMKLITSVCDEISDHSYKIDAVSLKPKFEKIAQKIVEEKKDREVKQLFLVNTDISFVIAGIINELFYKHFREIFAEKKQLDISNLEFFAKSNYSDAYYELNENITPHKLYYTTTNKPLDSEILPRGTIYKHGCYIYLTGDEINDDIQITWGEDNECK